MSGFIKLHRDIMSWEWYTNIPVRILFEHCLLKANYESKRWHGIEIKAGSFVTSLDMLAFETGLTKMQVRTALKKLILTHEITHETTTQYSIITVKKWCEYQTDNTRDNTRITHEQHTDNTQITLTKEIKNIRNKEEEEEEKKENVIDFEKKKNLCNFYGEFKNVFVDKSNYETLKSKCYLIFGSFKQLDEVIQELSEKIIIEKDKYQPYAEDNPDAHFIWLKRFLDYKQKRAYLTTGEEKNATEEKPYNHGF